MSNICCICHKRFEGEGNNPLPINKNEKLCCCDACNQAKVFPAKIKIMKKDLKLK